MPNPGPGPGPGPMGCVLDETAKEQFWGTLPFENIMGANPDIVPADDGADIFLFDAEAAYLATLKEASLSIPWAMSGIYLLNHKQIHSDCTSHGSSGAMEDEEMVDIMWRGTASEFHPISSECLYGGAVVTMMGRRGDNGAFTHSPLDYAIKYGFLPRAKYGSYDLTNYNGNLVLQFCKSGVPSELLPEQIKHQLRTVVPIHSFEEGSAILRQGFSVVGGSNQGFSLTRDIDGFCRPQGSWAHCTRFRGRRGGKKPGWAYGQSWGAGMPGGPNSVTLDSGRVLPLPEGTFFVDPDTINRMIGQGEFYGVSKLDSFPLLDYKLY